MLTFVLVHGAWHDGPTWAPVAAHLTSLGHVVHTPTVAGHGRGVDKGVSHDDCVASIADYITEHDLHEVVLVGHSFGGTVIARVSEEVPDRIGRLVFWNAFVPQPGNSLLDEVPPHTQDAFSGLAAESDDNTVTLPFDVWRETFIQDGDSETAKRTYEMLSSEPFQPFVDKLDLTRFYESTIPRSFVNATEDTALTPGEWGWHPRMSSRLGSYRLVQLPGSHEVMFTAPARLADAFVAAGRE